MNIALAKTPLIFGVFFSIGDINCYMSKSKQNFCLYYQAITWTKRAPRYERHVRWNAEENLTYLDAVPQAVRMALIMPAMKVKGFFLVKMA